MGHKARPPSKKAYHHGDLRPALVDAALAIVQRHGLPALTMRAVARKAKVSHMAAYHHFADKAALVAAVAEEGFRALRREMLERIARFPDNPFARLRESGIAYVVFAVKNPNLFRVMFGPLTAADSQHPGLAEAASATFDELLGLVRGSQESKATTDDVTRQIGVTAWALVHGLAMLCIDGQLGSEGAEPEQAERLAYMVTGGLFHGLRDRSGDSQENADRTQR